MQIYVVKQNDTLSTIARSFGTTAKDITEANELPNPNNLVIGQALVIPIIGSFYLVRAGDNLWSISRKFQVSYQQLAAANRIPVNQPLQIGSKLYIPQHPKTSAEFNWVVYAGPSASLTRSELPLPTTSVSLGFTSAYIRELIVYKAKPAAKHKTKKDGEETWLHSHTTQSTPRDSSSRRHPRAGRPARPRAAAVARAPAAERCARSGRRRATAPAARSRR